MVDRRRFLEGLAALGIAQAVPARAAYRKTGFDSFPFTLGVASGYPQPDGMVLWTRLMGELGPATFPVRWEVAADDSMRAIVARGSTEAHPAWAHAVHVEPRGLEP